eukprot:TRINITY_DN6691_c0_g1_i4.p1 TRINITY_DN6691_c0_g1~~TRINITY_DN6691_c0_g1_i4.p1  ORF type:complete len:739 (+),score=158.15 TRINITY_DN6691_c0_g1_i4:43-2259(+)
MLARPFARCLGAPISFVGSKPTQEMKMRWISQSGAVSNRLSKEKSLYLRQHATNPVDWYPWGFEAFQKAKDEGKPIFLSVGYSTCHWCHVMEKESFQNEEIAKVMNENFVNIKVDREERPDVDGMYMTFLQAMTRSGGWPMSIWMTPDLKPFMGGVYFPPQDRDGRPGFLSLNRTIAQLWGLQRNQLIERGDEYIRVLRESFEVDMQGSTSNSATRPPTQELFDKCLEYFNNSFDEQFGGFGANAKFPRVAGLQFILNEYYRNSRLYTGNVEKQADCYHLLHRTLKSMSMGGIRDHVGGGFHRYSVDPRWEVPHFEKMLYDQAQLISILSDGYLVTQDSLLKEACISAIDYVSQNLSSKDGGFYSAVDADSLDSNEKVEKEGAYYVWRKDEIANFVKPAYLEAFCQYYSIEPNGNIRSDSDPHGDLAGQNVLRISSSLHDAAEIMKCDLKQANAIISECLSRLEFARLSRSPPQVDEKCVAAWNGLMISALTRAFQAFQDKRYLDRAINAARFIEQKMVTPTGDLCRVYFEGPSSIEGFADDYAFVIQGLLDIGEETLDSHWIRLAWKLQQRMDVDLIDDQNGGYFSAKAKDDILIRRKDDYDGAEPCANSVAVSNLYRLAYHIKESAAIRSRAERLLECFRHRMQEHPQALPLMMVGLSWREYGANHIHISGALTKDKAMEIMRLLAKYPIPRRVVTWKKNEQPVSWDVTICVNQRCLPTITSIQELTRIVEQEFSA